MSHWYPSTNSYTRESKHRNALSNTSGNIRPHYREESEYTFDFNDFGHKSASENAYPVPSCTVPSQELAADEKLPLTSESSASFDRKLAARKAKRAFVPPIRTILNKAWLRHPKYISYRERKRKDTDKNGRTIWSGEVEDSFQAALLNIPAMGRRKKTQHGKPHGRNELIAEWILQDTGEIRTRKQVSSHIQVLGKVFAGVSEWRKLTVAKEGEAVDSNQNCYFDSIADMVRLQRQIADIKPGEASGLPSWTDGTCSRHELVRMKFDMWVALPENVTEALHTYSQLHRIHAVHDPTPLEDLRDWRDHYPGLESILLDEVGECDIILLKTSFSLMTTFPPQNSKLGLVVELDFRHMNGENFKALSQFSSWKCINSMFQQGYLFRKTEHKNCKIPEIGVVKPFFEADWWAGQFTRLTDKRKLAEDQGDETAVVAADDFSRNFFTTLTMMQEIFALAAKREDGYEPPPKRMAILLWTFSQAHQDHRGTTTWQKLIPPISSNSVTTPVPQDGLLLLGPGMDSNMDADMDTAMETVTFCQGIEASSPWMYQSDAFHTGLTLLHDLRSAPAQTVDLSTLGPTGFTPRTANQYQLTLAGFEQMPFIAEDSSVIQAQPISRENVAPIFDSETQEDEELEPSSNMERQEFFSDQHDEDDNARYSNSQDRHQPLAKFDVTTHMMLQAQLRDHDPNESFGTDAMDDTRHTSASFHTLNPELIVNPNEMLSDGNTPAIADLQVSFIGNMDDLALDGEAISQALTSANMTLSQIHDSNVLPDYTTVGIAGVEEQHPIIFHGPQIERPPLLAHHSFAGVLTSHETHNDGHHNLVDSSLVPQNNLGFETPTRNDFAKLMSHMQNQASSPAYGCESFVDDNISAMVEHVDYVNEIRRPRSQPLLPSHPERDFRPTVRCQPSDFPLVDGYTEAEAQSKQEEDEDEDESDDDADVDVAAAIAAAAVDNDMDRMDEEIL